MRFFARPCYVFGIASFVLLACICAAAVPAGAQAGATISVDVRDTTLRITAKTAPLALVSVKVDGNVIGTGLSDRTGEFDKTFTALKPGMHYVAVWSQDEAGRLSGTVSKIVNFTAQAQTVVPVFLPPVSQLSPARVAIGETVRLEGSAYPHSSVRVALSGTERLLAEVSPAGTWKSEVDTTDFSPGTYDVQARAYTAAGEQSEPSPPQSFEVIGLSQPPPATNTLTRLLVILLLLVLAGIFLYLLLLLRRRNEKEAQEKPHKRSHHIRHGHAA